MVDSPGERYSGSWITMLADVLDEAQLHSDPLLTVTPKYTPVFFTVSMKLSGFETIRSTTIGADEVLDFELSDKNEGRGQEQSAWHLLENLFEGNIFHSPQVVEAGKKRELTDILTHTSVGINLFESKVTEMLAENSLDRSTERREKNIQNHINKGIDQLVGAFRNVKASLPLRTKQDNPIEIPNGTDSIHNGIVLISEMLSGLDWEAIYVQLSEASEKCGAMLHILDLRELRTIVGISRDNPVLFAAHLSHRFDIMSERKHALLRTTLNGPPLP
ncbi:MAG TPA: hypothetical protein DD473_16025 [Planctomycetaceae bacterium]|nr:hypothetical protein [Planctomycetaceae bacterium]